MFANSLEALQADLQLHKFVAKIFWLGDVKIELTFDAGKVCTCPSVGLGES